MRTLPKASCKARLIAILMMGGATIAALQSSPALAQSPAAAQRSFDIPAQPLSSAVTALGIQASLQVSMDASLAAGKQAQAVHGAYTPMEAASRLLTGTGLVARITAGGLTIEPASEPMRLGAVRVSSQAEEQSGQPPADGARVLGPIRVGGVADGERKTVDVARTEDSNSYTPPAEVTAFKMPMTLRETPQTVTVVPQAVIEDFKLLETRDILEFTPGVQVRSERNTESYYFLARGFEMQTQYDGVPSPNGFGQRGGASPDAAFLDRMEVVQGAAGLLTGPGKPGGTVNIVRKTPTASFMAEGEAGLDSFGGYRFVGDVSGPVAATGVVGRLVAVAEQRDLFIDHADAQHDALYGALETTLGDRTTLLLGATYEHQYGSMGAHFGNPTFIDGTLLPIPREKNLGATWAWQDDEQYTVFLRGQHDFGGGWRAQALVSYEATDFEALESVPGLDEFNPTSGVINLYAQYEGWQQHTRAIDLYAQGPVTLFGREHQLMFGANGYIRKAPNDPYQPGMAIVTTIDLNTWDPRNGGDPTSITYDSMHWGDYTFQGYGAFGAGRFSLRDDLHLITGGRFSWSKVKAWYNGESKGEFTPYAGLVWDLSPTVSVYGSYSDIFEPQDPFYVTATGGGLPPVFGSNYEAGVKLELFGGAFNASAAVYRLDQTNLPLADPTATNPSGLCGPVAPAPDLCYYPGGLVTSTGLDLQASGEIGGGFQLFGGYSYIDQTFEKGPQAGQRYDTLTPRHMIRLAASYSAPDDKWGAGASVRYNSEIFQEDVVEDALGVIHPFRIEQKAHAVFGVYATAKLTDKVGVLLNVDNLFDETYLNGISYPFHGQVYGDPRKVTLTLKAKL